MTYRIAVYGTLKAGHNNHDIIRGAKFIEEGHIGEGYGLVVDGLPFLVEDKDGPGCYVEIYDVSAEQLRACDRLESHPSFYQRKKVTAYGLDTGHPMEVYCYIYPHKKELRKLGVELKFVRRF